MQNNFWHTLAQQLQWHTPWHTVHSGSFADANVRWFDGGTLNVAYNCLDRHLPQHAQKTALICESDDGTATQHLTYAQLHAKVCQCAHMLTQLGVRAGDKVTIYLPMIAEAVVAMLACARIGAVHSVVFGGFSAQALRDRIMDAGSKVLLTADAARRGGKIVPLKDMADVAAEGTAIQKVVVVQHTHTAVTWHTARDVWWHDCVDSQPATHECDFFNAEHPLFTLYTSGSTGKPKGLVHTSGGYLVWAAHTYAQVFNAQLHDVYFSTADVGWITGHTYTVYGPLANAATMVIFEGVPTYPTPARLWQIIDAHQVSILYTAPTAIRALMREGDAWLANTQRSSLRVLGSVGEPINAQAWQWYYTQVGQQRAAITDTWWQTETGGILIAPVGGTHNVALAGSATLPLQGIDVALLNADGSEIIGAGEGALCIKTPWPSMARSIDGDHARYQQTYFAPFAGYYCTGDGARRDEQGNYWLTGRTDDVLNVSGHRLGTAEIESALAAHDWVAEAAVVGTTHDIKGEAVYAYVVLHPHAAHDAVAVTKALQAWVRTQISPIATPDTVRVVAQLPKTRSGKIMRRILRHIANGQYSNLGDTSTLLNPEAVQSLLPC